MLRDEIINLFKVDEYGPLLIDEIKDIFRIKNIEFDEDTLNDLIKEMMDDYTLYHSKKNRIGLLSQFHLYKGYIHIKKKGFGFFESSELDEEVYIPKDSTNGSFDGDYCLVSITNGYSKEKDKFRIEGVVNKILKRNSDYLIGIVRESYNDFGNNTLYRIENDYNVNVVILDYKTCVIGDVVKIKFKNANNTNVIFGEIEEIIGNVNTPGIDILSIAYKYGFSDEISDEVKDEVEEITKEYEEKKEKEFARRKAIKDYSNRRIITIDGDDAKDLDDAISINILENGNLLLGVYIADVTYFVRENSLIDKKALEKGTSVYLVNKVLPMLPFKLCNDLCSLNEKEEKLVLALDMEIDKEGNLINYELNEAVIKSSHRMTYNVVNNIINDEEVDSEYSDILEDINIMLELSHILRLEKAKRGSLNFDIPEAIIDVDNNGRVSEIRKRERDEAEKIIEDFMVYTNEVVASMVYNLELPFIYRVHDEPDQYKLARFKKVIANTAFRFNNKIKSLNPKDLQKILNEINESDYGLSTMFLRMMAKAEYSTLNIGHFGLGSKCYTHYTSPIRRYPDLMVHRLLKKYIINSEDFYLSISENNFDEVALTSFLNEIAEKSSEQERKANDCEHDVEDMKMAEYMEEHLFEEFDGVICSVTGFGFFVRLDNLVEGLVSVADLHDDYYEYNDEYLCLEGTSKHKKYRLGDKVKVKCINASRETKEIDFILANDKIYSNKRRKPTRDLRHRKTKTRKNK